MFLPTKPSTAGSSVSDVAIVIATARIAPVASPLTNSMPMRYMPASEMITVQPAKKTALPDVDTALTTALCGSRSAWIPCRYRATMNERVVDPDADADHLRELCGELGNRHDVRDQADRREPHAEAEQRIHDRQAHREHRTEHHHQDHDRSEQTEAEGGRWLSVREVTERARPATSGVPDDATMSDTAERVASGRWLLADPPNWISANAIGLAGDTCPCASASNGDRTAMTSGTCRSSLTTWSIDARVAGSSSEEFALNTTIAVSPARAGNFWSSRSNAFCESVFGRLNVWLKLLPTPPASDVDADQQDDPADQGSPSMAIAEVRHALQHPGMLSEPAPACRSGTA